MSIEADSVAEDMIADTESFNTLKSDHQEDVHALLVTRQVSLRVCSSTMKHRIFSPSFLSWIRVSRHVTNEESSDEIGMSFALPDSQEFSIRHCAETCWSEKRLTSQKNQACLWFLAKREDDALDDERLKVFCVCWSLR